MNGGNILTLQKVLGHTTLAMTMRHTHLAPNHLLDAIRLRPASDQQRFLAIITSSGWQASTAFNSSSYGFGSS